MQKTSILSSLLLLSALVNAQQFNYVPVSKWQAKPVLHTPNKNFAKESAVVLYDDRVLEYVAEEKKDLELLVTIYKLVKVQDEKGIEMYNKIYVPVAQGIELKNIKARTITPTGKVIDLPANKIKEIEEEGRRYKLFAMEGVEVGSEIEYEYSSNKPVSFFGTDYFQFRNNPVQYVSLTIIAPEHLRFNAKGFNGVNASTDSLINGKRYINCYAENVEILEDEKYAYLTPNLKRVEYKLSYNLSKPSEGRLFTWKQYAKQLYKYYSTMTAKEDKALDNFLKKSGIENTGDEAYVIAIENYIKNTIVASEKVISDNADDFEQIFKTKQTNRDGINKLFACVFEKAGINYQMVFPSKRDDVPLDENLENWRNVEETIIFFPKLNKYLQPYESSLRYPYIDTELAGTKGLFLKTITIGELKTAIGSFGNIGMEAFDQHAHNLETTISFDKSMDSVTLDAKQIWSGYGAMGYRPVYTYLPQDQQNETTKAIIQSVTAKTDNIKNIKIENAELSNISSNKPLIIAASVTTADLLERAGNKVLFKIGNVIGPQAEMYQEKERKLPIEIQYPHVLERKIKLKIPAGYNIKNLNDLNFNIEIKDGNTVTMGFVSNYTVNGDMVDIYILETYRLLKYPISQIKEFVQVINAAADFNKVVLVFEKK